MINHLILFGSVTMTVIGGTLLKIGGRAINFDYGLIGILTGYLSSGVLLLGFAFYALAAILWVYCLNAFDFSYVSFVSSAQYILLVLVSIFVFNEQISLMKWAGCFFIMVGVVFWLKG